MAEAPGFEPGLAESKSAVLPLHNASIKKTRLYAPAGKLINYGDKIGVEPIRGFAV